MELTRNADPDSIYGQLADWTWLPGLTDLTPRIVTAFADVMLQGPDGWWFLDTMAGTLARQWDDYAALDAQLRTEEGQDRYLLGALAGAAYRRGTICGPGQVYVFVPPPILSRSYDVENVQVMDLSVALSVSGQLHRQVGGGTD